MISEVSIATTLGYVRALNSWASMGKGHDLPALQGVGMFIDGDQVFVAATNRYTIVQHSTLIGGKFVTGFVDERDDKGVVIIPFAVLGQFVKAASANKNVEMPVTIRIDSDSVEIQMYEILVRGAKIRGQYPPVHKLAADKAVSGKGVRTFGVPLEQFVLVSKFLAPASNRKVGKYDYQAVFSESASPDKAGPIVMTVEDDPDFLVMVQPRINLKQFAWKGATNG